MKSTWLVDTSTAVLKKALANFPDHSDLTARPVWNNSQLDKLIQGRILALHSLEGFYHAKFGETVARLLCFPSPSCQVPLGQRKLRDWRL